MTNITLMIALWGRTLGNLYIQGRPDQSHEGGVKMHTVVIGNRQVHSEQPLCGANREESMRKATCP